MFWYLACSECHATFKDPGLALPGVHTYALMLPSGTKSTAHGVGQGIVFMRERASQTKGLTYSKRGQKNLILHVITSEVWLQMLVGRYEGVDSPWFSRVISEEHQTQHQGPRHEIRSSAVSRCDHGGHCGVSRCVLNWSDFKGCEKRHGTTFQEHQRAGKKKHHAITTSEEQRKWGVFRNSDDLFFFFLLQNTNCSLMDQKKVFCPVVWVFILFLSLKIMVHKSSRLDIFKNWYSI